MPPRRQPPYLLKLTVKNYRSLKDVSLRLGPLNVLVGPNGAGKSNLLDVLQFLGDSVRTDIGEAVSRRGGYGRLAFDGRVEGSRGTNRRITLGIEAAVTRNSSATATDNYELVLRPARVVSTKSGFALRPAVQREERFLFKRTTGPGRRITLTGRDLTVLTDDAATRHLALSEAALALATLPRLGAEEGGEQVEAIASLFASFRVFDVDVSAARLPSVDEGANTVVLADDASNLSAFLRYMQSQHEQAFSQLVEDARQFVPGLVDLTFIEAGGAAPASYLALVEQGLRSPTPLAHASFGSIRAIALLALLYDPSPPRLTCIEEIDHGLHPYVLDRLVELLRKAAAKTQFLVATHSPSLVNRLDVDELIVCERGDDGESIIPAIDPSTVREMERVVEGELSLGELWFSGVLGGVPE